MSISFSASASPLDVKPAAPCRGSSRAPRGFSLIELMVALAIAMVLMGALAGIFASTINARQQVVRDGQKLENARVSIEALTEDLRLAGYYGNYTPAGQWHAVSWQPLTALENAGSGCNVTPLTTGWQASSATSDVRLPAPIMGFEAHSGSTTQTISASITGCLPDYQAGTDVLVIRRASTAWHATATATNTYLQVAACLTEVGVKDLQVSLGAPASDLHELGTVTSCGAATRLWPLLTHVYYIAKHNDTGSSATDSDGDNVPTLKMVDLSATFGASPGTPTKTLAEIYTVTRTITPGVVDFHLEYGVEPSGIKWAAGQSVAAGSLSNSGTRIYSTAAGGTTKTVIPVHVSGSAIDGTGGVTWTYEEMMDGSTSTYAVSNTAPRRLLQDGVTFATGSISLADATNGDPAWQGETNWHDVVAVKLWVVVRDPEETRGFTNAKSFVLGSVSVPSVTVNGRGANGAAYRYKASGSTVKLENMSARREAALP